MTRLAVGALIAGSVLFSCTPLGGCENRGDDRGPPDAVYTVRGRVEQLPEPGKATTQFVVHHEAVDTFTDANGKVVGMGAMSMPFPLAPGVSLEGVAIGDVVEITFAQWRTPGKQGYQAQRVVELAPDTELHFRAAKPPVGTQDAPASPH